MNACVLLRSESIVATPDPLLTMSEHRDKFAQLSCYAPNEVADDDDKQRRFLKGLYDGLQLQLMSNT